MRALSARVLRALPYGAVRERFAALEIVGAEAEPFWNAVRGNLAQIADARGWWRVARGEIEPIVEEPGYLAQAVAYLPPAPWDLTTWGVWTSALKAASGRKGRALFHPLRLALTGLEFGTGTGRAAPTDRQDQSVGSIIRTRRLTPSGPTTSSVCPWPLV